jgi:hypothetical protein
MIGTNSSWTVEDAECTIMGVSGGTHTVDFTQCDIGDAACISTFGPTVPITFTVTGGETYAVEVTSDLF